MDLFWRIILGSIVGIIGFFMIYKTVWFLEWTERIAWAEEKLGAGGTRTFLKILGLIIIFIGMFIITDLSGDILTSFAKIFVPG